MVRNALALNDLDAHDIMTPRTMVFRLPETMSLAEVNEHSRGWIHSRIPIYDPDDPERWTGLVRSADVLAALAAGRVATSLSELARPLHIVPEGTRGHVLLNRFITQRTHLFGVVDEFGGMAGVVSLEDVVESLVGREIVDESDRDADLREAARRAADRRDEIDGLARRPSPSMSRARSVRR